MAYIVTLCAVRWPLQWAADLKHLKAALLFGTMIFVMHKYKTVLYALFRCQFRFDLKFEFVLSLMCSYRSRVTVCVCDSEQ